MFLINAVFPAAGWTFRRDTHGCDPDVRDSTCVCQTRLILTTGPAQHKTDVAETRSRRRLAGGERGLTGLADFDRDRAGNRAEREIQA